MKANINKSNTGNDLSQFDRSKITTAAMIALIPSVFSILGVHDFMLKKRDQGILHLIIVVFALAVWLVFNASCSGNNQGVCSLSWLLPIIFEYVIIIALYIWSAIEGIRLLQKRDQAINLQNKTPKQEGLDRVRKEQKKRNNPIWSIVSLVTAIPSLLLWAFFLSTWGFSGMISDSSSSGGLLWVLGYYYLTIGIPLFVVSVIFAVIGFRTNYKWLSIISLCVKIATILMIVLSLSWLWLH